MAMDGRIPTTFEAVFPHGAFVLGGVTSVRDFKRSTRELPQQEVVRDENDEPVLVDGEPIRMWQVEVIEATDEATGGESKFRVKIAARVQPVPPPGLPGAPAIRPVVLEGLELRPWVNRDRCRVEPGRPHRCGAKVAWSMTATGLSAPAGMGELATAGNGRGS